MSDRLDRLYQAVALIVLAVLALVVGAVILGAIMKAPELANDAAAGWAQAIGSLIAIGVAIWVPFRLHAISQTTQRQAPLFALRAILDRANFLIFQAPNTTSNFVKMVVDQFEADLSFQTYRDLLDALNGFPIASLQDYSAVEAVFEMRRALGKICQVIAPIDLLEGRDRRVEAINENLYSFEECQLLAEVAMVHLQLALQGAGIK